MSRHWDGPLPTLGSHLKADVIYHVWCNTCRSCGRSIEPVELIRRFGQDIAGGRRGAAFAVQPLRRARR
jgi:hypothetical protein